MYSVTTSHSLQIVAYIESPVHPNQYIRFESIYYLNLGFSTKSKKEYSNLRY